MSQTTIPYGRQDITQADINAVEEVLRSDFLTQGPMVPRFEQVVAQYCGAKYGVALNSATSALHVACLALGVGSGDHVWTSPVTFVASANCARYCGSEVDFVDIDSHSYNICTERLADKLAEAEAVGNLPKVVILVHLTGQPCDLKSIHALGQRYGFRIIEDASHAIGGRYRGEPIGNGRYSDITVFSFHPVKIITTGEGGMALTNDPELANRMVRLRSHGITRNSAEMTQVPDGPWYYQQLELGFNYRMTDIQAALGISQMQRLDEYVAKRHTLAARYGELLQELNVIVPWQHKDSYSSFHLYVIRLQLDAIKVNHREVFERMLIDGIGVNLHYIPVYRQPDYMYLGIKPSNFPEAECYYSEAISLPMYPGLNEDQQLQVYSALRKAIR